MQLLSIVYPAAAGIGFFLAAMQFLIWHRIPERREFLFGALMSAAAGAMALSEAGFVGSLSLERFLVLMEIANTAIAATLIAMVWFVRSRLKTGRRWLAWGITISWTVCAAIGVFGPGNIAFSSLDSVQQLQTSWGEVYSVPSGTIHPLKFITDLTSLAIMVFVIDASVMAYRRGNRHAALLVGGPIIFFIVVAGIHTPLVDAGVIQTPYVISLIFVAISASLAIGLVDDVVRSAVLTRRLELERQRWNALLDGVELAVVRIAPDGRIAYVNPYLERLSGRSLSELEGKDPAELAPERDRAEVQAVSAGPPDWTTRSRVRQSLDTASGETRDLIWFSVALRGETGEPDGAISFGQDITDQLAAEAARERTEREYERLSRALTMGELASTFAHELSQPIAAVLSNAQTLEILQARDADHSDDETREIVSDILRDARRARDLMNRVREFMFNEAPKETSFELGEMIEEALEMLSAEARRASVDVNKTGPGYDVWVFAARLELQQIVLNLALNAMQALESGGGGEVEVQWRVLSDRVVELRVEDNGPGLSHPDTQSVFRPFVSSKSTGTGIGLAVVRRVAERHNGTVAVEKSRSGGASFVLRLPISDEVEDRSVG